MELNSPAWSRSSRRVLLPAVGALLLALPLTSCTANSSSSPGAKSETVKESPVEEPTEVDAAFETDVPKFRTDWTINRDAILELHALYEDIEAAHQYEIPSSAPEYQDRLKVVREEFLTANPLPDGVHQPSSQSSSEEILAWYTATSELYRQYYSDVNREQTIRIINENAGMEDAESEDDYAVLKGIELLLFNGLADDLSLREGAFRASIMSISDGSGDAPLPTVAREFVRADEADGPGQERGVRSIWNNVTVEGRPMTEVMNRFNYNVRTGYWDLTAELTGDGSEGAKIY